MNKDNTVVADGLFTKEQIDYVDSVPENMLRQHLLHQVRLRDNMEADRNSFEKQLYKCQQSTQTPHSMDEDEFSWEHFLVMVTEIVAADTLGFKKRHEKLQEIKAYHLPNKAASLISKERVFVLKDIEDAFEAGAKWNEDDNFYLERGGRHDTPNLSEYVHNLLKQVE